MSLKPRQQFLLTVRNVEIGYLATPSFFTPSFYEELLEIIQSDCCF